MKSKLIESHKEGKREVFNRSLGVYFNGEDNNYPTLVENLIEASPTATQCAWVYGSFLGGGGFVRDVSAINLSEDFNLYTPNDLLMDVAESISVHQGVFIHINYNANYQKHSAKVLIYDHCRIGKMDDKAYSGKVLMSKKGWSKELKKEAIEVIDAYNPNPKVIQAQVDAAGGWEKYKGQILFYSLQPKYVYPKSLIEGVYLFADTEYQMGLFFNATAKRGFVDNKLIRHKKFPDAQSEQEFEKNIKGLMGTENASSVMLVEDDWDADNTDGNVRIEDLKSDIKADRFAHFETASANFIRKAFRNIPPQLVDYVQGKLGNTSGEDLVKAQSIYSALTARDRMKIERLFALIFDNFREDVGSDWAIREFTLI